MQLIYLLHTDFTILYFRPYFFVRVLFFFGAAS